MYKQEVYIDGLTVTFDEYGLRSMRDKALAFTNKIRAELSLPAITELVRGSIGMANSCTLNKSISAEGLFAEVDYNAVVIRQHEHGAPLDTIAVPFDVKVFLKAFDRGLYPDLVEGMLMKPGSAPDMSAVCDCSYCTGEDDGDYDYEF